MKTFFLLLLLGVSSHAADLPGRFQIIAATIERDSKPRKIVIKIDTATGETWELMDAPISVPGTTEPTYVTGWAPLNQDWMEMAMLLQNSRPSTNRPAAPRLSK